MITTEQLRELQEREYALRGYLKIRLFVFICLRFIVLLIYKNYKNLIISIGCLKLLKLMCVNTKNELSIPFLPQYQYHNHLYRGYRVLLSNAGWKYFYFSHMNRNCVMFRTGCLKR